MNKKVFWLSIIGIVISFAGGFLLANALNRKEIEDLKAQVGNLKAAPQPFQENNSDQALSDDEIRQKISEADNNPENIEFQKNLAMALYRYATMKQDPKWLNDIARMLNRVYEKNPKDFNLAVDKAIGLNKKEQKAIEAISDNGKVQHVPANLKKVVFSEKQ